MKIEKLIELIKQSLLAEQEPFLRTLFRPVVNIEKVETPVILANSKFGGYPDLPKKFKWPKHDDGYYRFLCQINFAQIESAPSILPKKGLLSLFVADYIEDYVETEYFWGDPGYVIGYLFKEEELLKPCEISKLEQAYSSIEFESGAFRLGA